MRSALRRAATVAAVAALVGTTGTGSALGQSFLDPDDPCLGDPPAASFSDRGSIAEVHRRNVDCAAAEGIAQGKQGGVFDPSGTVTRAQMASFLVRTLEAGGHALPAPGAQPFDDVVEGAEHAEAIAVLAQIGVTKGRTATTFAPNLPVRRDEMASFVVRAAEFAYEGDELEGQAVGAFPFSDVEQGNTHRAAIAAAAELLGVSEGATTGTYDPAGSTTRAQMATFVVRLLDVTLVPQP